MTMASVVRDVAILVARIGVGVVFIAHGWQKLVTFGVAGTAASFQRMGVPAPTVSAWYASIVELLGGVALLVGLAVPVAGLLLVLDMLGAYLFVHAGHGILVTEGGGELAIALGAASLLLAAVGAGWFSLDRLIFSRRRRSAVPTAG
ncbi:DoxX family protein [Planosporangium sp. 12N6]|uniref:DoxX family protein n=1 Tax=Planosporangium spinosum TaxID=3402278 RepID=UPI003CF5BFA9